MKEPNKTQLLKEQAKKVSLNSYSPYSKFRVGAALEASDGNVFTGCNIENLAFPSGICAERTAIFKAVSEMGPNMKIDTLVIYTATNGITTPCGSCRQVISEFAHARTRIVSVCDQDVCLDVLFQDLLPHPTIIDGLK